MARLAGDELIAAKILAAIQVPFELSNASCVRFSSIGMAIRAPGLRDGAALLRQADAALYLAKEAGRGRFHGLMVMLAERVGRQTSRLAVHRRARSAKWLSATLAK